MVSSGKASLVRPSTLGPRFSTSFRRMVPGKRVKSLTWETANSALNSTTYSSTPWVQSLATSALSMGMRISLSVTLRPENC